MQRAIRLTVESVLALVFAALWGVMWAVILLKGAGVV